MKWIFLWLITLFVFTICNENESSIPEETIETPQLDEDSQKVVDKYNEQRMLIGKWYNDHLTKTTSFIFASDGTCIPYNSSIDEGIWEYDETTKYLTTTCGGWSFIITLLEMDAWTGTTTQQLTCPFKREAWIDPNDELLVGTWINETTNESLTFTANKEYIFKSSIGDKRGTYDVKTWIHNGAYKKSITIDEDEWAIDIDRLDGCYLNLSASLENMLYMIGNYVYIDFASIQTYETGDNSTLYQAYEGKRIEKIIDIDGVVHAYKYDEYGRISQYDEWFYFYEKNKVTVTHKSQKTTEISDKWIGYLNENGYLGKFEYITNNNRITEYKCNYNTEGYLTNLNSTIYTYENNSIKHDYNTNYECVYNQENKYQNNSNLDLNHFLFFEGFVGSTGGWHDIFGQFGFTGKRIDYLFETYKVKDKSTGKVLDKYRDLEFTYNSDKNGEIDGIGWRTKSVASKNTQYWIFYKK